MTPHPSRQAQTEDPPPKPRSRLARFFFGTRQASLGDELASFKFRFLVALMLAGASANAVLALGSHSGQNVIAPTHLQVMEAFVGVALLLWWVLRLCPKRTQTLAWVFEALCLLEFASAMVFVPDDELRLLWYYVNLPGVFIMLGLRAGWAISALSLVCIWTLPRLSGAPYSTHGIATASTALLALALTLHVLVARALSFHRRMQAASRDLERLASLDPLTGLLNARAFRAQGEACIASMRRSGLPCAVLFIDLDHFKSINDRHGHAAGDEVLRAVAELLQARLRRSDLLGRIGGEEFAVVLPDTDAGGALRLAETLRQAVQALQPVIAGGPRIEVTASIGVEAATSGTRPFAELMRRADGAMYAAKQAGRNRVTALG